MTDVFLESMIGFEDMADSVSFIYRVYSIQIHIIVSFFGWRLLPSIAENEIQEFKLDIWVILKFYSRV